MSDGERSMIPAGAPTAAKLWLITRDAHRRRCDHGLREDLAPPRVRAAAPSVAALPRPDARALLRRAAVVNVELARAAQAGASRRCVHRRPAHDERGGVRAQAFVRGEPPRRDARGDHGGADGSRRASRRRRRAAPRAPACRRRSRLQARDAHGNLSRDGRRAAGSTRLTPDPLARGGGGGGGGGGGRGRGERGAPREAARAVDGGFDGRRVRRSWKRPAVAASGRGSATDGEARTSPGDERAHAPAAISST